LIEAGRSGATAQGEVRVQARDPKSGRPGRSDGRPPFGLKPISRVGSAGQSSPPMAMSASSAPPGALAVRPMVSRTPPGFGFPNLRRNVCPHFYMTGTRGAIPIQAPHLLKALVRQDSTISRCQLRGGVHLEQGYVNDVCLSPRFNQCVFYEEDLTNHRD
jgi:hypothetical protein